MKKFTRCLLCIMLCICSCMLFACGKNKGDNFLPTKAEDEIFSNGGLIVKNGDYIYFNNGFVNEEYQKRNKKDYVSGSLVAAKLGDDGQPVCDVNGVMDASQTRYITQRLTSFEAGNVFIYGEYVYYTSPCQEQKSGGTWDDARKRVVFYRKHLNKSGKEEKIYQTYEDYEDVEFSYATSNGQIYLVVLDGEKLLRVSADGKKSVTIAEKFEDVIFEDNGTKLAYITNEDGKYILNLYNIITNKVEVKNQIVLNNFKSFSSAPELLCADGQNVYLKLSVSDGVIDGYILAKAPYDSLACSVLYRDSSKSLNYYFYNGIVLANKAGSIYRVEKLGDEEVLKTIITDSASSISIAAYTNGRVVYVEGDNIKAVAVASNNKTEPDVTIKSEQAILQNYYDVIGNNFYYFAKVNNNYYLHCVNLSGNNQPKMIGIYSSEDISEVEDASDSED